MQIRWHRFENPQAWFATVLMAHLAGCQSATSLDAASVGGGGNAAGGASSSHPSTDGTGNGGSDVGGTAPANGGFGGASGGAASGSTAGAAGNTGGGATASGGAGITAGTAGTAGAQSEQSCASLVGNYNLSLTPTNFTAQSPPVTLSLTNDEAGCHAVAALQYHPAVPVAVSVSPSAVLLDDKKGPNRPVLIYGLYRGATFFDEFRLENLSIARSPTGAFSGAVAAVGSRSFAQDDVSGTTPTTFTGSLADDSLGPVLRGGPQTVLAASRESGGFMKPRGGLARLGLPADRLLPWDDVYVEASEPTPGLASHLSLPPKVAGAFVDAPLESGVTAKDVWATTRFLEWEQVRGTTTRIAIAPGLTDSAGNAVAQTELPVAILDVGPAVESHELNDATNLGTFGDVSFLDGFATITAPCGNGVGGIAGRILTAGKTKLIVTAGANTSWQTTTLVRAVGKSGRVLEGSSLVNTVEGWARYEFSVENESEVGFSVAPNSMCHWTRSATAKVDRIYAE